MGQQTTFGSNGVKNVAPTMVLSFDIEDWNQMMGFRVGRHDWNRPGPAFERQMRAIFALLQQTGWKATFFLLGTTVEHYPDIIQEVVRQGHEIASHGYRHVPVYDLTPESFRRDLEKSIEVIEKLGGKRPLGYRAPYFSINRDCTWAFEVIAKQGFVYDSTQHDTPWVARRIRGIPVAPYRMQLPSGRDLIELPILVWKKGRLTLPIGGGSYWRVLPMRLLHMGLQESTQSNPYPALYFHPYEYDPEELCIEASTAATGRQRLLAAYLNVRFNTFRHWILPRVRHVASRFDVTTYERVVERLRNQDELCRRRLSKDGQII